MLPRGMGAWPYVHEQPDCVVLQPRPDVTPSPLPPVRIFLGTQPAQYRAERIFFWSIEQHRDPARRYEIYLMCDLDGFDRRGWRTGFTKYRFAIPELAGGQGKAIYNDVDQIYLADPALLFDLDMGTHGYLAISPEETSVMLIDCERMAPIWNRFTANRQGKHQLIKSPAKTKGLWGAIDGHWNARDLEYVEGRTMCLHYTLLHEQPWEPTPEVYSYHANPLGYIWHAMERAADAADYQVFTSESPSQDFQRIASGRFRLPTPDPTTLSPAILRRLMAAGVRRLLAVGFGGEPVLESVPYGIDVQTADLARSGEVHIDEGFDAVLGCQLFERLPPPDIPWVLDGLFSQSARLLVIDVRSMASEGFGSPPWWEKRIREAAAFHPGKSWQLEARPDLRLANTGGYSLTVLRRDDPGTPEVRVLLTRDEIVDRQSLALAQGLGWPYVAHAAGGQGEQSSSPDAPDLLIAASRDGARAALVMAGGSGGRTRVVQVGCPGAPLASFDLVLATPDERLPIRDNVFQLTAPLAGIPADQLAAASASWSERLADADRPFAGVIVGAGRYDFVMDIGAAERAAAALLGELEGWGSGTVLVRFHERLNPTIRAAFLASLGEGPVIEIDGDQASAHAAIIALADTVFVTSDEDEALVEAAHAGRPVVLMDLPRGQDRGSLGRPVRSLAGLLTGGGVSYRGTPFQQHLVSRWVDRMATRGRIQLKRDIGALHRSLIARGLARTVGQTTPMARPHPLDDLELVVRRVRAMMTEKCIQA